MTSQGSSSGEFERRVVEKLMNEESRPAQLCRGYDISPSLLYHWKRQYSRGKFNNDPTGERPLRKRLAKLERLVGELTPENEVSKRGLQHSLSQSQRNGRSSGHGDVSVLLSNGSVR